MLKIPTLYDGTAFYRSRVTLEGQDYLLDLAWRDRYSVWDLSLLDSEGNWICGPIRCYPDRPMLRYYHSDPRVPSGELMVVRLDKDRQDVPGLFDLGVSRLAELCYFPVVSSG